MTVTPILQFGTSRFLQAHADLFISQAMTQGSALGPVTVVQSSGDPSVAESFFARWTAWGEPHERLAAKLREAEGPRYRLVRYGALGE